MKKKISYMLIGALSTVILSYGVVAYADYDSSATKEDKPAASVSYVVPSKTAEAEVKAATAQPSASEAPIQLEQLKALDLKMEGNNVKIRIELEKEESKTESKVEIKIGEDQKKYLTGSEATQFIQQLLAALKLQANMDKQQVMDALFKHFAVEPAKVELNIHIKMKDRPDELKFKEEKDDDDDNDDAKVQTVQSTVQTVPSTVQTVQDNEKAQLATNDQLAKQEQKKALIAQKKALQQAWQKAHKEEQAKKKQQKQLVRSDRDHAQNKSQKDDEDDDDQGEDHGDDGHHGGHHEHEEHNKED